MASSSYPVKTYFVEPTGSARLSHSDLEKRKRARREANVARAVFLYRQGGMTVHQISQITRVSIKEIAKAVHS